MKWYRTVFTVVLVTLALVLSAAAGAWLFHPTHPQGLETPPPQQDFPVSSRAIDDRRHVQLNVIHGDETILQSAAAGLLTQTSCNEGQTVESGTQFMTVNDEAIIALATATPLWRDLQLGDTGQDVRAFQTELQRLGYNIVPDGEIGSRTLRAAAHLMGLTDKDTEAFTRIAAASFMWIPQPRVTVAQCHAQVGHVIAPGGDVATLTQALQAVQVAHMPDDLMPGTHVLTFGQLTLPLNDNGLVNDPQSLEQLQQQAEYQAWLTASRDNPQVPLNADIKLHEAQQVYLVAPSTIYNITGHTGCINDGGKARSVTIVSSELGQTFVTFDDGQPAPSTLSTLTGNEPSCTSH